MSARLHHLSRFSLAHQLMRVLLFLLVSGHDGGSQLENAASGDGAECNLQHNWCRGGLLFLIEVYICWLHAKFTHIGENLLTLDICISHYSGATLSDALLLSGHLSTKTSTPLHGQTSLEKCWLTNRRWSTLAPKMHNFHIPGLPLPEWPLTNGAGQICINGGTRAIRQMPLTVVVGGLQCIVQSCPGWHPFADLFVEYYQHLPRLYLN